MPQVRNNTASIALREIFQDKCDELSQAEGSSVVLSHLGTFSLDLVNALTDRVEFLMISSGDKKLVIKRMFTILIEGLNNVRKHGELDANNEQLGFVIVNRRQDEYVISMANLVRSDTKDDLIEYIERINKLTREQMEEKMQAALDYEFVDHGTGAGLGMIVTRVKTGNSLSYATSNVDDGLELFVFEVKLSREE